MGSGDWQERAAAPSAATANRRGKPMPHLTGGRALTRFPSGSGVSRGSAIRKRAPGPASRGSSSSVPPWSSTKRRATARPSPVPPFLPRVTKGSKRRSRISSGTPGPSSARTRTSRRPPAPPGRPRPRARRCSRPRPPMASRALAAMLVTARRSLSASSAAARPRGTRQVATHLQRRAARSAMSAHSSATRSAAIHRPPRQPAAAAGEVEGLRGHALEAVDHLHDQVGPRCAPRPRGRPGLEQRLRVAADHGHGAAEVVGQHAGHGAQRGHALGGDQLALVEVVLEGERGARGQPRDERRLGAPRTARAAGGPARREHQHAHEAAARHQGDQRARRRLAARGLDELAVREQVARLRGGHAVAAPAERAAAASHRERAPRSCRACGPRAGGWPRAARSVPGSSRVRSRRDGRRGPAPPGPRPRGASGRPGARCGRTRSRLTARKPPSL